MTVIWDERLITRSRAADLCGSWELTMDYQPQDTFLRCGRCCGNVTRLPSDGKILDIDMLISAAVRHMCMSHDYKLSGAGNERHDGSADYRAGRGNGSDRAADPAG